MAFGVWYHWIVEEANMYLSVPGKYRDGSVELTESLEGISESDVIVTFLAPRKALDEQTMRTRFTARMRRGIDFEGTMPSRTDIYADRISKFQ